MSVTGIDKIRNFIRRWHYIHRYMPTKVRIEASTLCQLKCTGCSFQNNNHSGLGGLLTFENFKRFIDENPYIREIELSNYGEIFLNPNLIKMMRYAREKGVRLTCSNGSNFNTVSEEQMWTLVETEFDNITLSIDGASQETYVKYRVGGNFDTVMSNVRRLLEIKKEMNSDCPKLRWQYVLNEYNELEVGKAKKMAKELGIPIGFKLNWDPNYHPVNVEYLKKETKLKELTENEYASKHGKHRFDGICKQVFLRPQINYDGRLLGCCTRQYATFDVNVFEVGLKAALISPKYMDAKRCLLTVHPNPKRYADCTCMGCNKRIIREKNGVALEL